LVKSNEPCATACKSVLTRFVVTRLACADTAEVERKREVYIATRLRYGLSFGEVLKILKGASAIGRQADMLSSEEVTTRLEAVQQSAPVPTTATHSSKFAKLKAWFAPAS
jgi:hypothetical protein